MLDIDGRTSGLCDAPTRNGRADATPEITIPDGLPFGSTRKAKKGLADIIHEALHAGMYNIPDSRIEIMATDITSLLWRLGYRRQKCK